MSVSLFFFDRCNTFTVMWNVQTSHISLRWGFGAQEAYDAFGAASSSVGDLQDGPHLKRRFWSNGNSVIFRPRCSCTEKLGPKP